MYDIITVGSATVDVFVETGSKLFKGKRDFVKVAFGSKILVDKFISDTGGGGTNTAVSLSRLGFKVAYLGKMGKGLNSQRILKQLKKEKVDCLACRENARTGYSIILDADGHDRTILVFKGSNNDLKIREVKKSKLKTKWFYFASMMGESFKTMESLASFASKKNIKILFNPSSYMAKKGIMHIKKVLKNTNILILNKEEATYLVGKGKTERQLKMLSRLIKDIVVITDGKNGVYAYDGNSFYYLKPHNIKIVEATGAGDAFASAFLAGIIKKNNTEFAMQLGLANAESVITHYGAKNKLLRWNETLKEINKQKNKVVKYDK